MMANVPIVAIYIDYQKSYARVWHSALIMKLIRLNTPAVLLKIIWSWLSQRTAYVSYGDINTKEFPISIGLSQESS